MSSDNWTLGITLGILGSVAINTGNNLQSLGLKSLEQEAEQSTSRNSPTDKKPSRRIPWLSPTPVKIAPLEDNQNDSQSSQSEFVFVKVKRNPVESIAWIIGTFIFVSGSLLNFASYAFAAQSTLASLESVQFVTNLIFGRLLLKAKITETMMAGTVLTVTGTVLAVQYSSKETLELTTNEIKILYHNPAYLAYLAVMACLLVVLHIIYQRLATMQKNGSPVKHSEVILPIVYSFWSALVGTQSVVQAKILAELLAVQTSGNENIFREWFTYVTLIAWIMTVVIWLHRLSGALKNFDPLFIIPLLQCSFIFFAIVSGGIFFQEFNNFDAYQWGGFSFGVIIMFSGLVLLTPKPPIVVNDEDLHRELLNLLLKQGGNSVNLSTERSPLSPIPTPNASLSEHINDDTVEDNVQTTQNDEDDPKLTLSTPRLENVTTFALDLVTKLPNIFHGNGDSTRIYSEAMVSASIGEAEKIRRRTLLCTLLTLIKCNPLSEDGYSDEIMSLLAELDIDITQITPRPDCDVAHRLCMTQEKLHHRILMEIEQSNTPNGASPPMPSQNLENQFNNTQ